jgi:dTDP-4-amino-4,6-dideoxygalactose transaminase
MKRRIAQIADSFRQSITSPYFGFVQGHAHIRATALRQIKMLVGKQKPDVIEAFETQFAELVGNGQAITYASARMGFYDLMRILGIGDGDEVILPGATCAVMANAILRVGATPVYSDIDPDTLGSKLESIELCVTPQTKMIVAQHSFGIPCNIQPIVKFANKKGIFLLEDCALAIGSKAAGVTVGNFGDAALFSTDHSKPINTIIGGLLYTRNIELALRLRESQSSYPELPKTMQQALWRRFLLEREYCLPKRYGRLGLIDLATTIGRKLLSVSGPFLLDDSSAKPSSTYPYPAKLPTFLAALGLIEIERWPRVAVERMALLNRLIEEVCNSRTSIYLPTAYSDKSLQIVPLRFVWFQEDGAIVRESIRHFVHVSWTWFMQPVIATSEPLENLGYCSGSCPVSEHIGSRMVNLPCNISLDDAKELISNFRLSMRRRKRSGN